MTENIAGAYVCSMRKEFNLRHNGAIIYPFVDSRDRIKTVVWTRIVRCVFDDKENALVWTGQQQIK